MKKVGIKQRTKGNLGLIFETPFFFCLRPYATRGAEGGEYRRDDRSQYLQRPFQCFLLAHKLTSFQFFNFQFSIFNFPQFFPWSSSSGSEPPPPWLPPPLSVPPWFWLPPWLWLLSPSPPSGSSTSPLVVVTRFTTSPLRS